MKKIIAVLSFFSAIFYLVSLFKSPTVENVGIFIGSIAIFLTSLVAIRKEKVGNQTQNVGKNSNAIQSGRDSMVNINNEEK